MLETPDGAYLFDTGSGRTLLRNAGVFGVPLAKAQAILLSHHHNDHTGGLLETIDAMRRGSGRSTIPVYGHPDLFKTSFYERNGTRSFSALPHTRAALETAGVEFNLTNQWRQIAPGIAMTGEVPRYTAFEIGDQTLKHYDADGQVVVDPIRDHQSVVIETQLGLVVVLGCSHAGLINILTYIREQTGNARFHTVLGGRIWVWWMRRRLTRLSRLCTSLTLGASARRIAQDRGWPAAWYASLVTGSFLRASAP